MRVHLDHGSALGLISVHCDHGSGLRCVRALRSWECTGMRESALRSILNSSKPLRGIMGVH